MLISYKKPRGRFFIVGKGGSGPVPPTPSQPDDEIWYTTSDGSPVDLANASFNTTVANHTYTGGKGVIKFDANLTEIGANSFENANIVTVSFPDTLTTIGDSAFDSCPITELDLKNIQSLGMEAFDYNYVSALHIPASVNSINRNPFRTPYGNQTITVDSNNTTYSDGGGCNCVYDETTHTLVVGGPNSTVPTGCTTIGEFAFSNCYGLTSIEFPASVTSIGWLAFGSDEQGNLATIRAHSVPTFESLAFMSVADNGTLYLDAGLDPTDWMNALPAGWTLVQPCNVSISAGANGLISVDGGTPTSSYTDTVNYGTQITIEGTGDTGYIFDQWSDGDSTNPRTLTVTSNVTLTASFQAVTPQQPDDEIWYTSTDNQVITPQAGSIQDLNGNTLNILSNTYENGKGVIKASGDIYRTASLFSSQTTLETISYPSKMTTVGGNDCLGCTNLVSVDFPSSVQRIGGNSFKNCTGLTSINIPNSVTQLDGGCFENCTGLTGNLVLPNGLTTIGGSSFRGCSGLSGTLALPSGLTTIEGSSFSGCSGFTGTLTLPSGLTSIGSSAFQSCNGFTGTLTIPNTITTISDRIVIACTGLTSVVIPDSVTSVGKSAFAATGITTVSLGNSVAELKRYAFENCASLTSITFTSTTTVPTLGTNVFNGVASTGTVYGQSGLDYSTVMAALPSGWTLVQ